MTNGLRVACGEPHAKGRACLVRTPTTLNEQSEDRLLTNATTEGLSLAAEILKVPHHGSPDFSPRMLEAVKPS
jgi:hypothetical protein